MSEDRFRVQLDCDPRAPRQARQAISDWLKAVNCSSDRRHDFLLMISELVTNAVVHARSAPQLAASVRGGRFRVEVYDDDRRPPVVRLPGNAVDGGGSGLRIVAGLSERWGWEPTATGKCVWAEAPC